MQRHYLTAKEYTAGIVALTDEDLVNYGNRIVPTTLALARLSKKHGGKLDRNILIQKCRRGQLRPMGRYGEKTLYFWSSDIDKLTIEKNKRRQKSSS